MGSSLKTLHSEHSLNYAHSTVQGICTWRRTINIAQQQQQQRAAATANSSNNMNKTKAYMEINGSEAAPAEAGKAGWRCAHVVRGQPQLGYAVWAGGGFSCSR